MRRRVEKSKYNWLWRRQAISFLLIIDKMNQVVAQLIFKHPKIQQFNKELTCNSCYIHGGSLPTSIYLCFIAVDGLLCDCGQGVLVIWHDNQSLYICILNFDSLYISTPGHNFFSLVRARTSSYKLAQAKKVQKEPVITQKVVFGHWWKAIKAQ